jgi:phospholipase C
MNRVLTLVLSIAVVSVLIFGNTTASANAVIAAGSLTSTNTKTPIKHTVVLFQENVSFDHYFGTYPHATNPSGEPKFMPAQNTPSANGLTTALLTNNPNGNYSMNPFRLDRSQAITCDMNHEYTAEQQAYHGGLVDKFVEFTGPTKKGCTDIVHKKLVMGYYDGNTVTALWNYER